VSATESQPPSPQSAAALLATDQLVKSYGQRRVVNGVSINIGAGEIVGLLGPNGAGKTTTFNMVVGVVKPDKGAVRFQEHQITHLPMHQRARLGIGYLTQEPSVFRKLTVEQNILAILEMLHVGRRERKQMTADLLGQFGLTKLTKSIAATLSGGERRRLEIARCLASKPTLILLDEPFTGIDPVTIQSIQEIIKELRNRGIGILLTDHREMETLTITDRNYIICDGRVLVAGDSETVLHDAAAQAAYFGKRSYHAPGVLGGTDRAA